MHVLCVYVCMCRVRREKEMAARNGQSLADSSSSTSGRDKSKGNLDSALNMLSGVGTGDDFTSSSSSSGTPAIVKANTNTTASNSSSSSGGNSTARCE